MLYICKLSNKFDLKQAIRVSHNCFKTTFTLTQWKQEGQAVNTTNLYTHWSQFWEASNLIYKD